MIIIHIFLIVFHKSWVQQRITQESSPADKFWVCLWPKGGVTGGQSHPACKDVQFGAATTQWHLLQGY